MYLSLCLIIKDENSYLQEWLDYHIIIGVDHFWIYDNESIIPVKDTLREYIEKGWVTTHNITGRGMQLQAYDHCVQNHGSETKWIGFIDTDEFIVTHNSNKLTDFLIPFEPYGGIAISSLFFGHGGNKSRPISGQLGGYRLRTAEQLSLNRLVKMIIQPEKVIYPISPHSFLFQEGNYCVNESGLRVDAQQFPCHVEKIQINHYFTRSEEEWFKKLSRGRGDSGDPYSDDRWLKVNQYSTVEDSRVLDLLQKLLHKPLRGTQKKKGKSIPQISNLSNELHAAAMKKAPVPSIHMVEEVAIPRHEIIEYLQETGSGFDLFNTGKLPEAREFYGKQIQKFPFDVMRYTNFASVCLQLKDFESAWSALAQAWRIAPRSLYVLFCMSDYFYAIGNFEQAEKTCLLAKSIGDLEPLSLAILAISQWKLGKQEEARITAQPLLNNLSKEEYNHPYFKELMDLMKS